MPLVVVTGLPGSGKSSLTEALAARLGSFPLSLDAIKEELAADAPDTPRDWLRDDAEQEVVRRLEAVAGEAVLDIWIAPHRDVARVAGLLRPWWDRLVEVRCDVPVEVAVARYAARERGLPHLPADTETLDRIREAAARPEPLGAPRTVVVDTTRPVSVGDLVSAVRRETGTERPVRRGSRAGSLAT
jgi:predicted kinase